MDDLLEDDGPRGGGGGRNEPEFSVSEISGAVKRALEDRFGRVRVRGEVGRVFRARSGHLYFDVKDDRAVLASVAWKGQVARLSVVPEEGMEVIATGKLTTFGSQSKYQLTVDEVEVAGEGALLAMLEKRRVALAAEGLFEPSRKRPLPFLPDVIGVVTSPGGAVIRDILHRLRDRFPRRVLIWPVAVQGKACAPEVTAAIRGFGALDGTGPVPRPDLLIVARGGGSIEDLWGFNEEAVVRAAAESPIPLISAVGHETDTTLIDHAADRRAPTPTAAAEMAVPVLRDLAQHVEGLGRRQAQGARGAVGRGGQRLADLSRGLPRPAALLDRPRDRLARAGERLPAALRARAQRARLDLSRLDARSSPESLRVRTARARARLDAVGARLDRLHGARMGEARNRLARLALPSPRAVVRERSRAFDALAARLTPAPLRRRAGRDGERLTAALRRLASVARARQARLTDRLAALDRLRQSLGYRETLVRGYAIVRDGDAVVTRAAEAEGKPSLTVEFADGTVAVAPDGAPPPMSAPRPARRAKPDPGTDQGTLF